MSNLFHSQLSISSHYNSTFNKCSGRHPGGPSFSAFTYQEGVYQFGSTQINLGPYIPILYACKSLKLIIKITYYDELFEVVHT